MPEEIACSVNALKELCIHLFYWTETLWFNWCPKNDYFESADFCPYIKHSIHFCKRLFYFFQVKGYLPQKNWTWERDVENLENAFSWSQITSTLRKKFQGCLLIKTDWLNIFHVQRCLFKGSILICLNHINAKKSCRKLIATFRTKINWEFSHSFFFLFFPE